MFGLFNPVIPEDLDVELWLENIREFLKDFKWDIV